MIPINLSFFMVLLGLCLSKDPLLVTTTLGQIKGHYRTSPKNVRYKAFEGIPFAEPPLGKHRFKNQPPIPIKPWSGLILANKTKELCWGLLPREHNPVGTEDCLYLNIYVPIKQSRHQLLPVIIYIYGGAFHFSALQGTEQNNFMNKDVVFVSFNHRHGVLGFLSTEDEVVAGNMGLKDQVMVLQWVKHHIRAFGGDSNRVTLFGSSSGGASVHYHYLSPMTAGLFHRGISLSGTALMPWAQAQASREKALILGKLMNCTTNDVKEMVQCLRDKPARLLFEAQPKLMGWRETDFAPFGPVVEKNTEDAFIDSAPARILSQGGSHNLPWITGIVSEEGLWPVAEFGTNRTILKEVDLSWESIAPKLLKFFYTVPKHEHSMVADKIRRYYFDKKPIDKKNLITLTHLVGDRLYGYYSMKAAQTQATANTSPIWYYYFSYKPSLSRTNFLTGSRETLGTSHGDDEVLIFREIGTSENEKNDFIMQKKLIKLWVSFAHTGQPSSNHHWNKLHPYSSDFDYLEMAGPKNFKMVSNNTLANNKFWASIAFEAKDIKDVTQDFE